MTDRQPKRRRTELIPFVEEEDKPPVILSRNYVVNDLKYKFPHNYNSWSALPDTEKVNNLVCILSETIEYPHSVFLAKSQQEGIPQRPRHDDIWSNMEDRNAWKRLTINALTGTLSEHDNSFGLHTYAKKRDIEPTLNRLGYYYDNLVRRCASYWERSKRVNPQGMEGRAEWEIHPPPPPAFQIPWGGPWYGRANANPQEGFQKRKRRTTTRRKSKRKRKSRLVKNRYLRW